MAEQVGDRHGEIVVRVHEPDASRHDAVPIVIGIARPRDVEAILEPDESPHRIGRRAVHPDLSVPIDGHEAERRVYDVTDNLQGNFVMIGDLSPVENAGAAERVDAELETSGADCIEVDRGSEIGDIATHVIMAVRGRR